MEFQLKFCKYVRFPIASYCSIHSILLSSNNIDGNKRNSRIYCSLYSPTTERKTENARECLISEKKINTLKWCYCK